MPPTLLIAATEIEAAPLRSACAASPDFAIEVLGVGDAGVARLRQAMVQQRPGRVVAFGLAGALAPDLAAGDAVLSGCGGELVEPLRRAGVTARTGALATVAAPLHGRISRDQLRARTGADAVQMEDAHWSTVVSPVPFGTVRIISDDCDLPLPLPRHLLLDRAGRVRLLRWLAAARRAGGVRRLPSQWLQLRRARREWLAAMRSLDCAAAVLVDSMAPQ